MSDIIAKLRSQIGDDVQQIYDHEALFRIAADRIEALEAERDTAIAAAYEAAAQRVESIHAYAMSPSARLGFTATKDEAVERIRALTPADAIAARDADRARVRRKALEDVISHKWLCFHKCDVECEVVSVSDIRALTYQKGDSHE